MRSLSGRVRGNLAWLVIFSIVVVIGAMLAWTTGLLFADTYEVTVPMPEAGGVLPGQEVTVLGRAVGTVDDVEITGDGVLLSLRIEGEHAVPDEAAVRVLRRSPIGEQAVDFQPTGPDWVAADDGARIVPTEAITPAPVPFLLEQTVRLLRAIDTDDLATIIEEAALALDGRGATLRQLNRDALALNRTFADAIPTFERLIDSSAPILEQLREHRAALAESFTHAADLNETLAEQRPTLSALLDSGTRALNEADALIRNERANLTCLNDDLIALNRMLTGPSTADGAPARLYDSKLDELDTAFRLNRRFFQEGFFIIQQPDPDTGVGWTRILFTTDPPGGEPYPGRRQTPPTEPGAACVSEAFGTGVNAVRQDDHQPAHFTSPGIDFAPLVPDAPGSGVQPPGSQDGTGRDVPLPATGGGVALLGAALLAAGLWLRRRTS